MALQCRPGRVAAGEVEVDGLSGALRLGALHLGHLAAAGAWLGDHCRTEIEVLQAVVGLDQQPGAVESVESSKSPEA